MTSNGVFSFEELNHTEAVEQRSSVPLIATSWNPNTDDQEDRTLYSRVAEDESTLELVREKLVEENVEIRSFQPLSAVVVTWRSNMNVRNSYNKSMLAERAILSG